MKVKIEIEFSHVEVESYRSGCTFTFYEDEKKDNIIMDIDIEESLMNGKHFDERLQSLGSNIASDTLNFKGLPTRNMRSKTKIIEKIST